MPAARFVTDTQIKIVSKAKQSTDLRTLNTFQILPNTGNVMLTWGRISNYSNPKFKVR